MKCHFCGEEMNKGKTTYTVNKHNYHLIIDDVSAWICSQCGEVYFEEESVDVIQNMIKSIDMPSIKIIQNSPVAVEV
ncbi:MAG: hypothetical protein CVT88_05015 [Candidatus Altiarchaeales archaeon HGW-Altiarchaeales-1]|nr:MAG: hypothetical protein CVT88_05015 [Candidatus Altiarchaeales archaeon HGW-Altiarchaeales-1]